MNAKNLKEYIAPDGGGMLHLNDKATLDGQETTANQNPILYLAYMARAIPMAPVSWPILAAKHGQIVSLGKGRYLRRKGDPLRQSHDNVLAWAWFSSKYNLTFAKDIYDFAKWRFFIYDPHHFFSLDLRCALQGSQVFTLKLAANKRPSWINSLWFAGSCVISDHSSDSYLKSMLQSDIVRARQDLLSPLKKKIVFWGLMLLEKRRENLHRWYKDYYRDCPEHPAVIASNK